MISSPMIPTSGCETKLGDLSWCWPMLTFKRYPTLWACHEIRKIVARKIAITASGCIRWHPLSNQSCPGESTRVYLRCCWIMASERTRALWREHLLHNTVYIEMNQRYLPSTCGTDIDLQSSYCSGLANLLLPSIAGSVPQLSQDCNWHWHGHPTVWRALKLRQLACSTGTLASFK